MAWYKTGTLAVEAGATSVSGTDTKFASNARVGDGIRLPDGEWYEIVNIASEVTLGIYPAYQGSTVSGSAAWMIAPLQGYVKESADRLRAIVQQYRDIAVEVQEAKDAKEAAQVAQVAAKTSETNAKSSETESKTSETNAKTSETSAAASKDDAAASQVAAKTSETNAKASEDKAKAWATNPEDSSVETGQYSALHWAAKAKQSADSAAASNGPRLTSIAEAVTAVNDMLIADTTTTLKTIATGTTGRALLGAETDVVARRTLKVDDIALVSLTADTTVDIGATNSTAVHLTGNGTVNSFGSGALGVIRTVRFLGTVTLVNSSNLRMPGLVDLVTAPGDIGIFGCFGSGVWITITYTKNNGQPVNTVNVANGGTGANNATDARTNLGLGTVATLNVTTSNTDIVGGRVLKVGDLGIGLPIAITTGADLNTITTPGTYVYAAGNTPANSPVASAYELIVSGRQTYPHQTVRQIYNNNIWVRSAAKADPSAAAADWTAWQLISGTAAGATLTTGVQDGNVGRVLRVGDWGLGSNAISIDNLNTLRTTCFFLTSGSVTGAPTTASGSQGYGIHIQHANQQYATQEFTTLTAGTTWRRTLSGNTWTVWEQINFFGTGGIGKWRDFRGSTLTTGAPSALYSTGTEFGFVNGGTGDSNSLSIPGLGGINYGTLQTNGHYLDGSGINAMSRVFHGGVGNRMFIQTANTATAWYPWAEVVTSSNSVGDVSAGTAIVQSGTNANGSYVRFVDGTQICTGVVLLPGGNLSTTGVVNGPFAMGYPGGFVPNVIYSPLTVVGSGGSQADVGYNNTNGIYLVAVESGFTMSSYRYNVNVPNSVRYAYTAIGRWK